MILFLTTGFVIVRKTPIKTYWYRSALDFSDGIIDMLNTIKVY